MTCLWWKGRSCGTVPAVPPPKAARKGKVTGIGESREMPRLPDSPRFPWREEVWHPETGKLFRQRSLRGNACRAALRPRPRRRAGGNVPGGKKTTPSVADGIPTRSVGTRVLCCRGPEIELPPVLRSEGSSHRAGIGTLDDRRPGMHLGHPSTMGGPRAQFSSRCFSPFDLCHVAGFRGRQMAAYRLKSGPTNHLRSAGIPGWRNRIGRCDARCSAKIRFCPIRFSAPVLATHDLACVHSL